MRVRFTVSDEEYVDLAAYVASKRRWRRVSDFLRDACFQTMERYPASAKALDKAKVGTRTHDCTPTPVGGTAHASDGPSGGG